MIYHSAGAVDDFHPVCKVLLTLVSIFGDER